MNTASHFFAVQLRPIDMPRNLVGYYDDENFYFESDAAYAAGN